MKISPQTADHWGSGTYFLELGPAICRQRGDTCMRTQEYRLLYTTLRCFLTVLSCYPIFFCRVQGCGESWEDGADRSDSTYFSSELEGFVLLTWSKRCNTERNKQQRWKFHLAVLKVLKVPPTRVCHCFPVPPSYINSLITCFERTGGSGTIVPPYLRHTDVSLFSLSKPLIVPRHTG